MARTGSPDPATYLLRLEAEPAVLDDLVAEITVGETYFFRDPAQLEIIRDAILIPWSRVGGFRRPMRIWSAGCASGEEPYSLGMLLHKLGLLGAAEIVGTDIARTALGRARRAHYGRWSLRATPPEAAARYFLPSSDGFTLAPAIRQAVDFRYLNLARDAYPSFAAGIWGMDLILCRNVLIYFDAETVRRVATRLIECLEPDGWLVTGASDPPLGEVVPCEVVVTSAGLAYRRVRRRAGSGPGDETFRLPSPPAVTPPAEAATVDREPTAAETPARALRVQEPTPGPTLEDALQAYRAHDYLAAAEAAHRLTRARDADPAAWVVLVRALANAGQMEAAGRACAAGLDRHRTNAELAYLHGVLLAEGGKHAEAAAALKGALYLDREMAVAHLALAGALTRIGDRGGARRALRNASRVLDRLPAEQAVPASDEARADRLAEATRIHLALLTEEPA